MTDINTKDFSQPHLAYNYFLGHAILDIKMGGSKLGLTSQSPLIRGKRTALKTKTLHWWEITTLQMQHVEFNPYDRVIYYSHSFSLVENPIMQQSEYIVESDGMHISMSIVPSRF